MNRKEIFSKITSEISEQLKRGVIPWKKSWNSGLPRNAVSKRNYNGVNFYLYA